ncbi:MAG: N-acetylmuramoyl-L-alanine amidase, partial [Chloroflexi bacterium]|nr:N-acetylmuramoyl-L-alanine amidase [Chloroflexota bacterium]
TVQGSPFRGTGARDRVTLRLALGSEAVLTVKVVGYDGRPVRTLVDRQTVQPGAATVTWDGRNAKGQLVPDGPYRFRSSATTQTDGITLESWLTKAPGVPYPQMPGAIVVAINPGHGGSDTGARVSGTRESDLNLDISLRLQRMLLAAGISVVMTRTRDMDVNRPALDRTGDSKVNHTDELVRRNDIANIARADLMLNIHNNATACRCVQGTQMFVSRARPWAAANLRLGNAVQAAHIRRLRAFQSRTWKVRDRGIGSGAYISLDPATPSAPRSALMPAILGESLYLDRAVELARLRNPKVRTAIAAAYFDGVTVWLAQRAYGIRYTDIVAPQTVTAGGGASVRLRIRDTGRKTSASWRLEGRLVPRVPVLDGSRALGRLAGSVAIPDGLAPGDALDLELPITLPATAGDWLLKLDVVLPSGARLSARGVVQPQMVITTTGPTSTPDPTPTPSPKPSPEPTPEPAPTPTPSPEPTPEPAPTPTPSPEPPPQPPPSSAPSFSPGP